MLTALKLLATAGLGVGYLALAFVAEHPRVDDEYRAHYLRRTATCWVPQILRARATVPPAVVELGPTGYPEACRYLRQRWRELEPWGVWSQSREATIEVPHRPGAQAVELTLRAAPPPNPAIHAHFMLDGAAVSAELPAGTIQTVTVPLPPEGQPYDPRLHITYTDDANVPNEPKPNRYPKGGTRKVGLGLIAIRYLPAPDAGGGPDQGSAPQTSLQPDLAR